MPPQVAKKGNIYSMKKTILIILAVLPIVLLVVIAFAGRILALYQYIPVEKVEVVDRMNSVYEGDLFFTVEQGKSKETIVNVYPKLASNKAVTYSSQDESICTVDENGIITGVHWGNTTVTVKTQDGNKTFVLNVEVTAKVPFAVALSDHELDLKVGQTYTLSCEVDAPVAVNKAVKYTSSNTSVATVDVNGNVKARGTGTAVITVTTELGERVDTCTVTVVEGVLPIYFDFDGNPNINKNASDIYVTTEKIIDLRAVLRTDGTINPDDVKIKIVANEYKGSGENKMQRAKINENGILEIYLDGTFTVMAYVGDENAPTQKIEYKFGLQTAQ